MYKPCFQITSRLLQIISDCAGLRAWIENSLIDVPWLSKLQAEAVVRLAHSSTAIEGNPLTLPEVEALARGEKGGGQGRVNSEVLNYLTAIRWIGKQPRDKKFCEGDLLKVHRMITKNIIPEPGKYKTRQNRVVDYKGHTVYTPPPPAKASDLTRDLLQWVNSSESKQLHPIIVSSIAHHQLVSIHPFADGNGRIARALGLWILYSRGFDTHHIFSLDDYFDQDRQKYYQTLQQARDLDDDLTVWLEYVAKGVLETLHRTKDRISSLKVASPSSKIFLTQRQEELLRFLRERGRVRTAELESSFKITRSRLNQILKPLVDLGLVLREGQTRATSYRLP